MRAGSSEEAARMWRLAGQTSALGLQIGLCVAVGAGLGAWADRAGDCAPLYTLVGFGIGTGAAVSSVLRVVSARAAAGRRAEGAPPGPPPPGHRPLDR